MGFLLKDYTNRNNYYAQFELLWGVSPPQLSIGNFFFLSVGVAILFMLFEFYLLASKKRWAELLVGLFGAFVTLGAILNLIDEEFRGGLIFLLMAGLAQTILLLPKSILLKIKVD